LFITTANWLDPIHPALRDRLEVLELPSYTESEKKLQNCQTVFGGSAQLKSMAFETGSEISRRELRDLIHDYTPRRGVRQLEREIAALTRKATRG